MISNVGKMAKDKRFKVGIKVEDLTRNEEVIEETMNDQLMLQKLHIIGTNKLQTL